MEMTIEDFDGKYDAASGTFTMTVPQALLIRPPERPSPLRTDGEAASSHQEAPSLTIRLSPHATWLLGQVVLIQHQLGRPFGAMPQPPSGALS